MLTGQAKRDYQRRYMREYRKQVVRPSELDPDHRVVVSRATYEHIKGIGGWSDGFVDSMLVVSDA